METYVVAKVYLLLGGYHTTIKSLPADLFHHEIRPWKTFKQESLFCGTNIAFAAVVCC